MRQFERLLWCIENCVGIASYQPDLPFLGKVTDQIGADQFWQFLVSSDSLESHHSGHRAGFGMETTLVTVAAHFLLAMEKANLWELILLDLAAIFDTVDYENLLGCLLATPSIPMK